MTDPTVRIGHCCPDAPNVDIHVDGDIVLEDVAFRQFSDYLSLSAGEHAVAIAPHGDDDAVLEATVRLDEDTNYTVIATGMLADDDLQATVFVDDPGTVPEGMTHARFVHCSPDAPAVTVRVADGGPTLFDNFSFREASGYEPVDAGTYDLEVVPAGSDDVVLSLPGTSLPGGSAITAVAIGRLADNSLDAIVEEDARVEMAADD